MAKQKKYVVSVWHVPTGRCMSSSPVTLRDEFYTLISSGQSDLALTLPTVNGGVMYIRPGVLDQSFVEVIEAK